MKQYIPLGISGREGIVTVVEDLTELIKSSQSAQSAFRESEGRVARIEADTCRGYVLARESLRKLLAADLDAARRLAEKNRPSIDLDCVEKES